MHENFSLAMNKRCANIHKLPLNQFVDMEGFQLDSTTGYCDKHDMIEIIVRSRRIDDGDLSVSLGFIERVPIPGSDANDFDRDLDKYLWVGLRDSPSVNFINLGGAICNMLFQNKQHMVASGLCTESQYESGMIKLVDHIDRVYEHLDGSNHAIVVFDHKKVNNEWDNKEEVVFQ